VGLLEAEGHPLQGSEEGGMMIETERERERDVTDSCLGAVVLARAWAMGQNISNQRNNQDLSVG
jgi:hypothetical protein